MGRGSADRSAGFLTPDSELYFFNRRHFTFPAGLSKVVGKPMLFSLSNGWAKFYQVDSHRQTPGMKGEF